MTEQFVMSQSAAVAAVHQSINQSINLNQLFCHLAPKRLS